MHLLSAVLGLLISVNFWIGVATGAIVGAPALVRLYRWLRVKAGA
jgi:hypothetical protein